MYITMGNLDNNVGETYFRCRFLKNLFLRKVSLQVRNFSNDFLKQDETFPMKTISGVFVASPLH